MRQMQFATVILVAACIFAQTRTQAQLRTGRPGSATEAVPPVVHQPPTVGQQLPLDTLNRPTNLVVAPPPPVKTESSPDGGDSDCRCPSGQKADIEGWCWRPTDAASGYWAKAEKCQR